MKLLRPNARRAKTAIILIWIVFAFDIASLISGLFQYSLLKVVAEGGLITQEEAQSNDLRERIIAILYFISYIISAIMFIRWFRRAYYNLHLKSNTLLHSEGWAAGAWFIPIISLFRPYQIMKELYQETTYILSKKECQLTLILRIDI